MIVLVARRFLAPFGKAELGKCNVDTSEERRFSFRWTDGSQIYLFDFPRHPLDWLFDIIRSSSLRTYPMAKLDDQRWIENFLLDENLVKALCSVCFSSSDWFPTFHFGVQIFSLFSEAAHLWWLRDWWTFPPPPSPTTTIVPILFISRSIRLRNGRKRGLKICCQREFSGFLILQNAERLLLERTWCFLLSSLFNVCVNVCSCDFGVCLSHFLRLTKVTQKKTSRMRRITIVPSEVKHLRELCQRHTSISRLTMNKAICIIITSIMIEKGKSARKKNAREEKREQMIGLDNLYFEQVELRRSRFSFLAAFFFDSFVFFLLLLLSSLRSRPTMMIAVFVTLGNSITSWIFILYLRSYSLRFCFFMIEQYALCQCRTFSFHLSITHKFFPNINRCLFWCLSTFLHHHPHQRERRMMPTSCVYTTNRNLFFFVSRS